MSKGLDERIEKYMQKVSSKLEEIGSKVDKIDKLEEKIEEIDKRLGKIEKTTPIAIRPLQGQEILPDVYSTLYPNLSATSIMNEEQNTVDVDEIVKGSFRETLDALEKITNSGEKGTIEEVAKMMNLHRTTISTRLNMLAKLELVERSQGKKANFSLTQKAKKYLAP